ncbi:hypothetical protein [Lacunimicrobium album]|jgi:hypothetical protein
MAPRKNTERIDVYQHRGMTVLDMGDIEIWDGADLSLIRDMLLVVIEKRGSKRIAVEMSSVKYVPSGFFGMLFDWFDRGIEISILSPQDNVRQMLWCKRFFSSKDNEIYHLHVGPQVAYAEADASEEWSDAESNSEHEYDFATVSVN